MSRLIDLTGERYGKLVVIKRVENDKNGASMWECQCDCGNKKIVRGNSLKRGNTKSCGCLVVKPPNTKHGESGTPLYRKWISILRRCESPKCPYYKDYGGRGITVCEEWHDFLMFKKWVEETQQNKDFTIDRIDNDKGYSPDNCRWASKKVQANNRRSNILFEYKGDIHNLEEWSKILNFDYKRVHSRMYKLGWSFEKSISVPVDIKKRGRKVKDG